MSDTREYRYRNRPDLLPPDVRAAVETAYARYRAITTGLPLSQYPTEMFVTRDLFEQIEQAFERWPVENIDTGEISYEHRCFTLNGEINTLRFKGLALRYRE